MFTSDEVYEAAVGLLKTCQPPLVSQEGFRWVGKRGSKSGLIAWVEVLEYKGIMRKETSRTLLSRCLMNTFEGLMMDTTHASLWEKRTTAAGECDLEFKSLLEKNSILSSAT